MHWCLSLNQLANKLVLCIEDQSKGISVSDIMWTGQPSFCAARASQELHYTGSRSSGPRIPLGRRPFLHAPSQWHDLRALSIPRWIRTVGPLFYLGLLVQAPGPWRGSHTWSRPNFRGQLVFFWHRSCPLALWWLGHQNMVIARLQGHGLWR